MERLTKKMENGNGYLPATEAKTTGEFTIRYAKELQRLGELEEKVENGELVEAATIIKDFAERVKGHIEFDICLTENETEYLLMVVDDLVKEFLKGE